MPILEVQNLNKTYKSLIAVNQVSFKVNRGQIIGLLGPNGAGKTTIIKSILGLLTPDSGTIIIDGIPVDNSGNHLKKVNGLLEGSRNFYMFLTPLENIEYFMRIRGESFTKKLKENIIKVFGELNMSDSLHKRVEELSRGMQQKLAIANVFLTDSTILLLDEPTLGLDVETANYIKSWITDLARKFHKTILITSHNMNFIESICDRIIVINKGVIRWQGSFSELHDISKSISYRITIDKEITSEDIKFFESQHSLNFEKINMNELNISFYEHKILFDVMNYFQRTNRLVINIVTPKKDLEKAFIELTKD